MSTEVSSPVTAAQAVIADANDMARRQDVFFRVRREPGEEMSMWWPIGAFAGVSLAIVTLMRFLPTGN